MPEEMPGSWVVKERVKASECESAFVARVREVKTRVEEWQTVWNTPLNVSIAVIDEGESARKQSRARSVYRQ